MKRSKIPVRGVVPQVSLAYTDDPPLPYPDGWFCVALTGEVRVGHLVTRRLAGRDLVLYRTDDGAVQAVDAYCPHLGAHLGVGGKVDGDNLVCPFHNFTFDPGGTCVHVPYGPAPRAPLRHFPVREIDGFVMVWRHHAGEPPTWEFPSFPDPGSGSVQVLAFAIHSHPQEILENVADYQHLIPVHGVDSVEETGPPDFAGPVATFQFWAKREVPIIGSFTLEQNSSLGGLGCAMGVLAFHRFGIEVRAWGMLAPVEPWLTHIRIGTRCSLTRPSWLPRAIRIRLANVLARLVTRGLHADIMKDVPIWTHKKYQQPSRLASGDGPIGRYRHWAAQFYPPPEAVNGQRKQRVDRPRTPSETGR
ncbi:Rieske 2Fe-2S domain-containing protein [Pseudonocardia sp. TRM90224]|uniref:Rieske 2Fe-2S domain-containing protein n=1 Tax=Pseudonocardia sp. TRM90224 TaxID=2812678 RepID=UPI001E555F00|nr:Rieske 2Fe-2S domain-containing protein [Pseudonocardia sp. TRM90224]